MSKSKLGRNPLKKKHFSAVEEILLQPQTQTQSAKTYFESMGATPSSSSTMEFVKNLQQMQIQVDVKKLFSSVVHLFSFK